MDFTDELAKVVLSTVAKTSIDRVVSKLSKKASKAIDPAVVRERLEYQARRVCAVKTLLSTESHVPIEEFYCAPRLSLGGQSLVPASSRDFRYDHILIEGVAGQGKSILLRHLCSNAILKHGKIAFYYELRRLDPVKPIIKILMESLQEIGLPGNSEALKVLAVERDVEIYLDGFDEVDQKAAEKVDRDINYLATNHPFIKVFVSARPHVGLSKNSGLYAYKIEDLNKNDVNRLIDKLCRDDGLAASLKSKLASHSGNAIGLLETPLLVTLLVAQYKQTQQIPEQLSEFYDSIFAVLFERHDSFKSPFHRKKRLSITTHAYRKIFQPFCFGSLFATALNTDVALRLVDWSVSLQNMTLQAHDFLLDVSDVSSLINEEAGFWSFIHNSVQEFYAAAFILAGTDEELRNHAARLSDIPSGSSRDQVFRFAREIDEFRFLKFVELPFFQERSMPLAIDSALDDADVLRWLVVHTRSIAIDKNWVDGGRFFSVWTDCAGETPIRLFAPSSVAAQVEKICGKDARDAFEQLAAMPSIKSRMLREARARASSYLENRRNCERSIAERADGRAKTDEFLNTLLGANA